MANTVAYVQELPGGAARVRGFFSKDRDTVTTFAFQLEAWDEGVWKPVRRYDDAHGHPHLDLMDRSGSEYKKEWLHCSRNEALTLAQTDFRENWEQYVAEFLEDT